MPSAEGSSPSSLGELAALGKLFQEHRERLLGMLRRRMPPLLAARTDADAILQDAYLQARRRWERFKRRPDRKPLPWLYRIALDCLIEAWRKETRAKRDARRDMPLPEDSAMAIGGPLIDTGTGPVHAAERDERRARVLAVMEQLRPEYREVLHMRHLDGLSHAEAAGVLGITANAATVRDARACRNFQELWRRLNPDSEFGPERPLPPAGQRGCLPGRVPPGVRGGRGLSQNRERPADAAVAARQAAQGLGGCYTSLPSSASVDADASNNVVELSRTVEMLGTEANDLDFARPGGPGEFVVECL